MILGVKKQIINSIMPNLSSFTNKLLQNERKYITEFKILKRKKEKTILIYYFSHFICLF